jgi:hypothetical protein
MWLTSSVPVMVSLPPRPSMTKCFTDMPVKSSVSWLAVPRMVL